MYFGFQTRKARLRSEYESETSLLCPAEKVWISVDLRPAMICGFCQLTALVSLLQASGGSSSSSKGAAVLAISSTISEFAFTISISPSYNWSLSDSMIESYCCYRCQRQSRVDILGVEALGWDNNVHFDFNYIVHSLALPHIRHATLLDVLLHFHTYVMLRCWTFSCTPTHTSCDAAGPSLALPHIRHAALLDWLQC